MLSRHLRTEWPQPQAATDAKPRDQGQTASGDVLERGAPFFSGARTNWLAHSPLTIWPAHSLSGRRDQREGTWPGDQAHMRYLRRAVYRRPVLLRLRRC